jgi:hypothetical protein
MPRSARARIALRLTLPAAGLALGLGLVELAYRFQWVDTYRPELELYNDPAELARTGGRPALLVMGDSMTAGSATWAGLLRTTQDRFDVINASISGTGVIQAAIVAPERFERFAPERFVYQVFPGNDLFDVRYPVEWGALPFERNLYWSLAHRLRSLAFLNYRLVQTRAAWAAGAAPQRADPPALDAILAAPEPHIDRGAFAPERYTEQIRLYFRAEPHLLENQILVRPEREADYRVFLDTLGDLLAHCDPAWCRAAVLVIPHAAQVDARYLEEMRALGARFDDPDALLAPDPPFLARLREHLAGRGLAGVQVIDPSAVFREHERQGRPVYFRNDVHLSQYGQAVLADAVARELGL